MDPPPYSRDPETASIRSAAPSYTSAAPSYRTLPAPSPGLPSASLSVFRPSHFVSTTSPNTRHYHSIASRRAASLSISSRATLISAALQSPNALANLQRQERERDREREIRTLEDPRLVGEEAARANRKKREWREGLEVLEREDVRWDWLLAQMSDWEERERSWNKFRREVDGGTRIKLARWLGMRKDGAKEL